MKKSLYLAGFLVALLVQWAPGSGARADDATASRAAKKLLPKLEALGLEATSKESPNSKPGFVWGKRQLVANFNYGEKRLYTGPVWEAKGHPNPQWVKIKTTNYSDEPAMVSVALIPQRAVDASAPREAWGGWLEKWAKNKAWTPRRRSLWRRLGQAPKCIDEYVFLNESYAIKSKQYDGLKAEMLVVTWSGQMVRRVGAALNCPGQTALNELDPVNDPVEIKVRGRYEWPGKKYGKEVLHVIDVTVEIGNIIISNVDKRKRIRMVSESMADKIMQLIADAIYDSIEEPQQQSPQQVATQEPQPGGPPEEPDTSREAAEPAPESEQAEPQLAPPTVQRPPQPELSAEERIARMDEVLKDAEDELLGSLLLIMAHTRLIEEMQTLRDELKEILRRPDDPDDPHPENTLALKEKVRKELNEIVQNLKELVQQRESLVRDAMARMDHIVSKVEAIYNEYGFGELDFNAQARVVAARERREYFRAEVALARNDPQTALRLAERLKGESTTRPLGMRIEAMALLKEGRLVEALEAIRHVRRMGYAGTGETLPSDDLLRSPFERFARQLKFQRSPFDFLERQLELRILRALQHQALAEKAHAHQAFNRWLDAFTTEDPDDPNANPWNALWILKAGLWRGLYSSISGTLGRLPGVESSAEAKARQVGAEVEELALNHVGLNLVYGLRNKGLRLDQIQNLNTEKLREAVKEFWGVELSTEEALQKLRVLRHAFQITDLKNLASGQPLTELDVLSGPLLQQIESDALWGLGEKAAEFGASAGNMFNGELILILALPHAKLAGLRSTRLMSSVTAARELSGVATVSEAFSASRPVTWAVNKMSQMRGGKAFLNAMTAIDRFSQQGRPQFAAVFLGEMAVYYGAANVADQVGGKELRLLTDIFLGIGPGNASFWSHTFQNVNMGPTQLRRIAERTRSINAALQSNVERMSSLAGRTRQVLESAGEGALDRAAIQQLRREVAKMMADAPPELTSKLRYALDLAESGYSRAALQTLKDHEKAAAFLTGRAQSGIKAAGQMEQVASYLPEPKLRRLDPGDLRGTVIVDNIPGGGRGGVPATRPQPPGPGGEIIPYPGPRAGGQPRLGASDQPTLPRAPGESEIVAMNRPALPPATGESDVIVMERGPRQRSPTGTRGVPEDLVLEPGVRMGPRTRGSAPEAEGGLRPRAGQGSDAPRAEGGPSQAAEGLDTPEGPAGPVRDASGLVDTPISPRDAEEKVFHTADQSKNALTHKADKLMAGNFFDDAAIEYTRVLRSAKLKPRAVETIVQKRQIARQAEKASNGIAKLGISAEKRGIVYTGLTAFNPRLTRVIEASSRDARLIGKPAESASGPRPIYASPPGVDGKRVPLAWAKSLKDFRSQPIGTAEALGSELRRAANQQAPVTQLMDLELAGHPAMPWAVTRQYPSYQTLKERLVELARNGQQQRIIPELLARKDAIAEDMVWAMLLGDGDRHFGQFLILNDGRTLPIDHGFSDLFPQHMHYRNYSKYNEHAARVKDPNLSAGERAESEGWMQQFGMYRHPDIQRPPDINNPAELREYVEKTMEMHFTHLVRQQRRHLRSLDPGGIGYYTSAFRYEDLRPHIENMQRKLQGQLDDIVRKTMEKGGHTAEEIEFTRKLLKERMEYIPEFFRNIDERFEKALNTIARDPAWLSFLWPAEDGFRLRPGLSNVQRARSFRPEWRSAA